MWPWHGMSSWHYERIKIQTFTHGHNTFKKKTSIAFNLHNVQKELHFGAPISPFQYSIKQSSFPFLLTHNLNPNILCLWRQCAKLRWGSNTQFQKKNISKKCNLPQIQTTLEWGLLRVLYTKVRKTLKSMYTWSLGHNILWLIIRVDETLIEWNLPSTAENRRRQTFGNWWCWEESSCRWGALHFGFFVLAS